MAGSRLLLDDNNYPVQLLQPQVAHKITVSGATGRNSTAFVADVIRLTTSAAMYYKLGGATIEAAATDHYIPAGVPTDIPCKNLKYIAVIGTGDAYISELG